MEPAAFRAHPDKTSTRDYVPSYDLGAADLGEAHRRAAESVAAVPGWLRPEDVLKLYELAYHATGPILEIGTYRGKSGALMAMALRDAGRPHLLVSVDVDPTAAPAAAAAASVRGVRERIVFVRGSAEALFAANPGFRPSLVFVDGDHSEAAVRRDLETLETRVPAGALLVLHDYLDPKNDDPADEEVGVVAAVRSSWVERDCEFAGTFGACGLFRRLRGGPPAGPDPGAFGLLRYDSPRLQYRQRVRWPLGRAARRLLRRG